MYPLTLGRLALGLLALTLLACDDEAIDATPDAAPPTTADAAPSDAAPSNSALIDAALTDTAPPDTAPPDAAPLDATSPGGCLTQRWSTGSAEIELWPDPTLLVADEGSVTGWRLDPTRARWLEAAPSLVAGTLADLDKLNGFARLGGIILRFDGPVYGAPSGWEASVAEGAAVVLLDLSVDPPVEVPYEPEVGEAGATLFLRPMVPLKPAALYAALAGPGLTSADGGCVRAALERLEGGWLEAVERGAAHMGWGVDALAAATAFVTQDARGPIVEAAASIPDLEFTWTEPPVCEAHPQTGVRRCEAAFEGFDFRDDRAILTPEPQPERWRLPVTLWLPPADLPAPYPVMIYGHGIASARGEGRRAGELLAPEGFAVLSVDALRHGEHPTATAETESAAALDFLGVDVAGLKVDGLALRGHFNQTALDKLQLIALARQAPDLDGDGAPELDPTRVVYWGISLGGMYGAPTLALADDVQAGVLSVAGGRLMAFATTTERVAPLLPALRNLAGGEGPLQRYLVVLQTLVDGGDPAMWGAHILRDRVRGAPLPLMLPVVLEDTIVPPITNRALARAVGAPHMEPVARAVDGLSVVEGPLEGNLEGLTVGYFQLDREGDPPVMATHNGGPTGIQGGHQARAFWRGWLEGRPVIIDPYAALGTPPLE